MSVVLPLPFGPTRATWSPRSRAMVTSRRSTRPGTETSSSSRTRTSRPLRLGSPKSKPRERVRRVSRSASALASLRSLVRRPICVSLACACLALSFLYRKRATKRSRRAMSTETRSAVFCAWTARWAFSSRQTCHGPGKNVARPASSSSVAFVTASRNQRSWATITQAASSEASSRSSHSRLATSRWFVGSSSRIRSGSPASERASEARVISPPENVFRLRSKSSSRKPRPRATAPMWSRHA